MIGKTLGHYEIRAPLGTGGMGEVYRARDSKLDRDVAIKVLPGDLAADPDRLARFDREARLLASLNHANIGSIYGLERTGSVHFLVLELIEGESLERRLQRGAIPVPEALDIARQIAQALEAAHDAGIIHRDVKPANVLLTPEGGVKVLDFGIAKSTAPDGAANAAPTDHVTSLTIDGTLMGTPPYMAPEQIRGEEADKRADIWAFGCVVYEMLTGKPAFARETVADTLVAVLEQEPDWKALPSSAPAVSSLLSRCLRKAANRRLRDIGDARIEIEEAIAEPVDAVVSSGPSTRDAASRKISPVLLFGIGVALGLIVAIAGTFLLSPETPSDVSYLELPLESGTRLWGGHTDEARIGGDRPSRSAFVLTPDGRAVIYAATDGDTGRLYLRRLENPEATPISDTEGGSSPFLHPNGQEVGFVVGRDIRVAPISGGGSRTILQNAPFDVDGPYGLDWTEEGIVFAGTDGIYLLPNTGGDPRPLTRVRRDQGESFHIQPELVSGGMVLLYTVLRSRFIRGLDEASIVALPLAGDATVAEPVDLLQGAADTVYMPSGHLLFGRWGVLMVAGFDPERLELTHEAVPVFEDVMQAMNAANGTIGTGAAQFSVSESGALLYAPGGVYPEPDHQPVWVSRAGDVDERISLPAWNRSFMYPRISPDGGRVAYRGPTQSDRDIIVFDLESEGAHPLPLPGVQTTPAWSPDDTHLAFESDHETGDPQLYTVTSDLSGDPERLTDTPNFQGVVGWSDDEILFREGRDIWAVAADGSGDPAAIVEGPERKWWPALSPNGDWLAYASDRSGQFQIYVRPYPAGVPEYTVTVEGGTRPTWSLDNSELFYRTGTDDRSAMMAVEVSFEGGFEWEEPRKLFDRPMLGSSPLRSYDVAADGRFLMIEEWQPPPQPVTQLRLVLNWFEELNRLVPTDGSR